MWRSQCGLPPATAAAMMHRAIRPSRFAAARCGARSLASSSGASGSSSKSTAARPSSSSPPSAPQLNLGLAAQVLPPPERSPPMLEMLGTVPINSGAAALRRSRAAERDENAIHEAAQQANSAAAEAPPPPPPIASIPTLNSDGLPLQQNDATTVLLIGWLGSKKHHLDKYAQMHRAAGRRVITYRPEAFGMLHPERWELPATQECIQQLRVEVEQGRSLVVHALSNLGAFQLAFMLHELEVATARGATGNNSIDPRPERTRTLLRTALRAIIFDSSPAPLSPEVILRGYVGFLASAGFPGWDRFTATVLGRKKSAHPHVKYDLKEGGWGKKVAERIVDSMLRVPAIRRHLHHLHVSLRTLIPPTTNLLYLYSTADELIPAEDILAHAEAQANNAETQVQPQQQQQQEHNGTSSPSASSGISSATGCMLVVPLSPHSDLTDLERGELVFQSRIHWLPPQEKRKEVVRRNARHAAEAILRIQEIKVENVRISMEQRHQPQNSMAPSQPQQPPQETARSSRFPLAEDDPAPLLQGFRSKLLRVFAAANKGFTGGSDATSNNTTTTTTRRAPLDVLHGTESATRAAQAAAQGIRLLRTVTSVHFDASPHVQHYRCYPRTYAAFIDAWLANHAAPAMPQCPQDNLQAVRQALPQTPVSSSAQPAAAQQHKS